MLQTNFYGRIASGDVAVVRGLLQAWLGTAQFTEKIKLSGEEIVHETDDVYVYAHAAEGPAFLLEGHRNVSPDEAGPWLQRLFDNCRVHGIPAAFEYVAVDDTGQEASEQYILSMVSPEQLRS